MRDNGTPPGFLAAELDTLGDEIERLKRKFNEELHSIIIETDGPIGFAMVFSSVSVRAVEPAAFAMVEADSRFEVPYER